MDCVCGIDTRYYSKNQTIEKKEYNEILSILDYIIKTELSFATRPLSTMASGWQKPICEPTRKSLTTNQHCCFDGCSQNRHDKIYGASLVAISKEGSQYQ